MLYARLLHEVKRKSPENASKLSAELGLCTYLDEIFGSIWRVCTSFFSNTNFESLLFWLLFRVNSQLTNQRSSFCFESLYWEFEFWHLTVNFQIFAILYCSFRFFKRNICCRRLEPENEEENHEMQQGVWRMDVIPIETRTSLAQHTLMIHATFCMPIFWQKINFVMNFRSFVL